jgi:NAD(P)-dependent dehydrogenase (short-subunit alcohol dehydrogenase family)
MSDSISYYCKLLDWDQPIEECPPSPLYVSKVGSLSGDVDHVFAAAIQQLFEVNAVAPMSLAFGLIPEMRRKIWGRIINVATSLLSMLRRGFVPHCGSKAALEAHSAIMTQDLQGAGVTVNAPIPQEADAAMIRTETGLERAELIQLEQLVPSLLWPIGDAAPNAKMVIAGKWNDEAGLGADHPATRQVTWSLGDDVAIMSIVEEEKTEG